MPALILLSVAVLGSFLLASEGSTTQFPKCQHGSTNCVVDGDTFRFNGEIIRVADIDAPETRQAKCVSEAELGHKATIRLGELLSAGPFEMTAYQSRDRDRYGRLLRIVSRNGRSIGGMLVSEGLARPWGGKRRPWC